MNIALIGSGGREHALSHKLYQSNINNNIYCIPEMRVLANLLLT